MRHKFNVECSSDDRVWMIASGYDDGFEHALDACLAAKEMFKQDKGFYFRVVMNWGGFFDEPKQVVTYVDR